LKTKREKSVSYHQQWPRNRKFQIHPLVTGILESGSKIEERHARYQTIDSHLFLKFSKLVHPSLRKTCATEPLEIIALEKNL
jgi:hypothetical protein